jgi:hypothetical protein
MREGGRFLGDGSLNIFFMWVMELFSCLVFFFLMPSSCKSDRYSFFKMYKYEHFLLSYHFIIFCFGIGVVGVLMFKSILNVCLFKNHEKKFSFSFEWFLISWAMLHLSLMIIYYKNFIWLTISKIIVWGDNASGYVFPKIPLLLLLLLLLLYEMNDY